MKIKTYKIKGMKNYEKVQDFLATLHLEECLQEALSQSLPENWEFLIGLEEQKSYESLIGMMTEEEKQVLFYWGKLRQGNKKDLILSILFRKIFRRIEDVNENDWISLRKGGKVCLVDVERYGESCLKGEV